MSVARWTQVNRTEQIVAAYAAGEAVEQVGKRLGISTGDVLRVVAQESAPGYGLSGEPKWPAATDAPHIYRSALPVASRKASTAMIRRFISRSSTRPSFWNIEPMCFSTARSLM